MQICSLTFLYLLLPAAIGLFAITPPHWRSWTLLLLSGVMYYWAEGKNLWLMVGVLLFDYLMAWLLRQTPGMTILRRSILICSVGKSVALVLFYSVLQQMELAPFPLGLGVYCLTSAGYIIDCYHNFAGWERNPAPVLLMSAFFPKLYVGPLIHYGRTVPQLRNLKCSWTQIGTGGWLFLCGLSKKVVIGDPIRLLLETLCAIPLDQTTTLGVWLMLVTLLFSLYFILSGYCDMARGLALVFGFEIPDNFYYPFCSKSVNEFFARFNSSVSRFMRRYVYVNLGGAQGGPGSVCFNVLLVSILMGLWFGVRLNLVAWGACMAMFVLIERYLFPKGWPKISGLFRWLYCMAAVGISFVFFLGDSLPRSFAYLKMMFRFGNTAGFNDEVLYLLASNYLVLALAVVISTGGSHWIGQFFQKKLPGLYHLFCVGTGVLLLICSTVYLVG